MLVHRLPGQDGHPFDIALQDGLRALDLLATLPPLPLLHVGLSSGGHLAGVMACQRACAGAVIAYAPLNANHRDHKFPAGKPDFPPPETLLDAARGAPEAAESLQRLAGLIRAAQPAA